MTEEWYYIRDGQQVGPLSPVDLKHLADTGQLVPTDMVSKKGLGKWVPASAINGLWENASARAPAARASSEILFADGEVTLTASSLSIGPNQFETRRVRVVDVSPVIEGSPIGAIIAFCAACYIFLQGLYMGSTFVIESIAVLVQGNLVLGIRFIGVAFAATALCYAVGRALLRPARNLWRPKRGEYQLRVTTDTGVHACMAGSDAQLLEKIAEQVNARIGRASGPVLHTYEPKWIRFVRTRVRFLFRD